jgi:hypothetical protein
MVCRSIKPKSLIKHTITYRKLCRIFFALSRVPTGDYARRGRHCDHCTTLPLVCYIHIYILFLFCVNIDSRLKVTSSKLHMSNWRMRPIVRPNDRVHLTRVEITASKWRDTRIILLPTVHSLNDQRIAKTYILIYIRFYENLLITMYKRTKKEFFKNHIFKGQNLFGLWARCKYFFTFWLLSIVYCTWFHIGFILITSLVNFAQNIN